MRWLDFAVTLNTQAFDRAVNRGRATASPHFEVEAMTRQTEARAIKDDEIDLREILGTILDRKWLIAAVTGLFFVVGTLYALLATPDRKSVV